MKKVFFILFSIPSFLYGQFLSVSDSQRIVKGLHSTDSVVQYLNTAIQQKEGKHDWVYYIGVAGTILAGTAIIFTWIGQIRTRKKVSDTQQVVHELDKYAKLKITEIEEQIKARKNKERETAIRMKPIFEMKSSIEALYLKLEIINSGQLAIIVGIKELNDDVTWNTVPFKSLISKGKSFTFYASFNKGSDKERFQTDTWIYYQDEMHNKYVINVPIIDGTVSDSLIFDKINSEEEKEFVWQT